MAVGPREWSPRGNRVHFFKVEELAPSSLSMELQKQVSKIPPDLVDSGGDRFYMLEDIIAAADNSGNESLVDEAERFYDRAVLSIGLDMIGKPVYVKLGKK